MSLDLVNRVVGDAQHRCAEAQVYCCLVVDRRSQRTGTAEIISRSALLCRYADWTCPAGIHDDMTLSGRTRYAARHERLAELMPGNVKRLGEMERA